MLCRLLQLVHEPEAAALAVMKAPQDAVNVTEGDKLIVVDNGGGTVDATFHKVSYLLASL